MPTDERDPDTWDHKTQPASIQGSATFTKDTKESERTRNRGKGTMTFSLR